MCVLSNIKITIVKGLLNLRQSLFVQCTVSQVNTKNTYHNVRSPNSYSFSLKYILEKEKIPNKLKTLCDISRIWKYLKELIIFFLYFIVQVSGEYTMICRSGDKKDIETLLMETLTCMRRAG